ncbi:hypothetical protein H9L39_03765 [Fusarium oxysporum f. sp. albedinis]|nr:hypothetical protein H9L39_03765 [Fusarium oxysporum f. sp. albedinis]
MPLFQCIVQLKEKGLRISKIVFSLNHTDIRNAIDSMRKSCKIGTYLSSQPLRRGKEAVESRGSMTSIFSRIH